MKKSSFSAEHKRKGDSKKYRHIVTLLAESGCGLGIEGVTEM